MKLLLHTCCAPCAIYPVKKAKEDGFKEITGFFYNPNIQPSVEFVKRSNEVKNYYANEKLLLLDSVYMPEEYFKWILSFDDNKKRCQVCWQLRLMKTVATAKENKIDAFTSTLLASPYQDHDRLKSICQDLSDKFGIRFYYSDFRKGFKEAHDQAKTKGMYCQNYCGCVFSLVEREESRRKGR